MYGVPDKYIEVIKAMHENKIAVVKVGNEGSSLFCIKPGVISGCVLLPFLYWPSLWAEFERIR